MGWDFFAVAWGREVGRYRPSQGRGHEPRSDPAAVVVGCSSRAARCSWEAVRGILHASSALPLIGYAAELRNSAVDLFAFTAQALGRGAVAVFHRDCVTRLPNEMDLKRRRWSTEEEAACSRGQSAEGCCRGGRPVGDLVSVEEELCPTHISTGDHKRACHPNAADGWMDRASDLVLSLESHEARRSLLDLIGIDVLHIIEMNIHPPGKSYRAPGMPILRSRHYCDPPLVAEVYGVV